MFPITVPSPDILSWLSDAEAGPPALDTLASVRGPTAAVLLGATNLDALDNAALVEFLIASDRLVSWVQARALAAIPRTTDSSVP